MSFGIPHLSITGGPRPLQRREDAPFSILIAGDFSGRENRSLSASLQQRKPVRIDLDRFDAVMAGWSPQLSLELPQGERVTLTFRCLDDFHPDRIWGSNAFFAPHRQMRAELRNPATFAAAMAALAPRDSAPAAAESAEDTWARLTGLPTAKTAAPAPVSAVDALVRNAVAGHLVSGPDPRQAEVLAAFDNALSGLMRAVLHHPAFQALESAWRGVDFLLRNADCDGDARVMLLDVSRDELRADLRNTEDVSEWGDLLLQRQTGDLPWSMVAGLFLFSSEVEADADLLARLSHVAQASGVPFIAGGGMDFIQRALAHESTEAGSVWRELRELPATRYAGLAAPRFLLRQPYGRGSDPIDSFSFEEAPSGTLPGSLLWGNSALLAALLAVETWRAEGWGFTPPVNGAVGGLPVYVYEERGEKKVSPCAEAALTDRAVENLLAMGVIPVAAVKDRDMVRLARIQSVSHPPAGLPW